MRIEPDEKRERMSGLGIVAPQGDSHMGYAATISAAVTLLVLGFPLPRKQLVEDVKSPRAIAKSGGVEIHEIHITRRKVSYSAQGADLINMTIDLWFPGKVTGQFVDDEGYLVKLLELVPIEDDTGKTLTTKARLKDIATIKGEIRPSTSMSRGGQEGPVVTFVLEAPARGATAIKSIKGKAQVTRYMPTSLRFDDLPSIAGKPLKHPKLKDFEIVPTVEVKDGRTTVTLRVPVHHARLLDWNLGKGAVQLDSESRGESPVQGGVNLEQTYKGDRSKGYSLHLSLAEPGATKVVEFVFKSVELP
jgi:hypothetical protein